MRLGLFLTPGAARAAYQAGAVQVLVEEGGLRFDVIAATSVGALNGAFTATGQVDRMVEVWSGWRTRDVVRVDWKELLRRGVWWSPGLMSNEPERAVILRDIDESRLLPGVRLRINLAQLGTGDQELFEWPGAPLALADAVCASVAVPGAIPAASALGQQWVDGLVVDGFPLEALLLEAGVDRAFVVGVAPRRASTERVGNRLRILLRSLEWNQFSETLLGLERAEVVNTEVRAWAAMRQEATEVVGEEITDPAVRARVLDALSQLFEEAAFLFSRNPVEIVPILPEHEVPMLFGDFQPHRSRALIEQGRQDARRVLTALAEGPPP